MRTLILLALLSTGISSVPALAQTGFDPRIVVFGAEQEKINPNRAAAKSTATLLRQHDTTQTLPKCIAVKSLTIESTFNSVEFESHNTG